MFRIVLVIGLFFSLASQAQTGAAGVGNAGSLPMWFDANSMNLTNGSSVSQFDDISGNGNHLTQSGSSNRPTYNTTGLNGLPVMMFDGVNDYLSRGFTAGLEGTNLTWFVVYQRAPNLNEGLISASYTSQVNKWSSYSNSGANTIINLHRLPAKHVSFADPGSVPTFFSTHITATNLRTYKQGVLQQSLNTAYTAGTGHNLIRVGTLNNPTSYLLNGFIAEIIVFNAQLNNLERIMVENYLGAKYNMAIPTDHYDYEATHNIGLIGLGNNGVNSQTVAQGAGIVEISNPADLGNNEYLYVGHTNDALSLFTTSDLPASLPTHQRFTRTWRADEIGELGTVELTFDLQGGNDFGNSSSYVLLVDNATQDGNFSDATEVVGVYSSGSVVFTVDLEPGDIFSLAGIQETLVIHSVTSDDWSNPTTWDCTCLPNYDDEVYIEPGHTVTVDVTSSVGYLYVDPTGTLEMTSDVTLNVFEELELEGTGVLTSGKIAFIGPGNQHIKTFGNVLAMNDFEVNKSSGTMKVTESIIELNGTFFPSRGSLTIDPVAPNEFIVNSTSAVTTGRIAPIGVSFIFDGKFTVRRFLPAGVTDYRDICSPVFGADFNQWDDDIFISGEGFPDGCAYGSEGCFYSIQFYSINTGYNVTDINAELVVGRGYEAYIGDNLSTYGGGTLDVTGLLNDGQDVVVTASSYYSTRGNPYASPVRWLQTTRSGMGNYFYVYDPATGFYEYYDGSDGSSSIPDLADGIIGIGQGFWVVGPGTITFTDASKTSADATFIRSSSAPSFTLELKENNSTYSSDISLSTLSEEGSDNLDFLLDITHFSTGIEKAPTLAMYSSEELIRKNYIKDDRRNKSFELYTKILNQGYHTIEALNLENFDYYAHIILHDNQTGAMIDLKKELAYTFFSETYEGHRFTLILSNEKLIEEATVQSLTINETDLSEGTIQITQMGNTFNLEVSQVIDENSDIQLVNVLGQSVVYTSQIRLVEGSNLITVPAELTGVHVLVVRTGDEMISKKVVL